MKIAETISLNLVLPIPREDPGLDTPYPCSLGKRDKTWWN